MQLYRVCSGVKIVWYFQLEVVVVVGDLKKVYNLLSRILGTLSPERIYVLIKWCSSTRITS